jgi:hypothetical protein
MNVDQFGDNRMDIDLGGDIVPQVEDDAHIENGTPGTRKRVRLTHIFVS